LRKVFRLETSKGCRISISVDVMTSHKMKNLKKSLGTFTLRNIFHRQEQIQKLAINPRGSVITIVLGYLVWDGTRYTLERICSTSKYGNHRM